MSVQHSESWKTSFAGGRRWSGSLAGRLAILLVAFLVLTTGAVVVREYAVGREQRVAEVTGTLEVEATVAADRLEGALAERARLIDLWARLESSQDLALDDVDTRVSHSLSDLVAALSDQTEAVAVRDGVVLSASDPGRLGGEAPALPDPVAREATALRPGVTLHAMDDGGLVVATADVVSAMDGSVLGRIVAWTPLRRFLGTSIPLELGAARVDLPDGGVLIRGDALVEGDEAYLWAHHVARTVAGDLAVSMGASRAEIDRALRASGRQLVTLAALFLIVALPASLLVVRTATSSLARLTRAARELDARKPAPLPAAAPLAPTEVHVLADAMSSMVSRLGEARDELARAESLAAVGMLTKSLAHEIRTPLSVLRAGTEMLDREAGVGPRGREVIRMLEAEVARLARLMDDLLVFGRPSTPVPRDADLADVAASAVDALSAEAHENGVGLELQADPTPVWGDPDLLRQVVVNLVTNGVRACAAGGDVVIRVRPADSAAVLEVEDDGHGIPADLLDRIWTPLVTTHRSGNGLGLPIVRQLVEAHGGEIRVARTSEAGTCMRVTLPSTERKEDG